MYMKKNLIPVLLCLAGLAGCTDSKRQVVTSIDGFAQGTYFHIVAISPDSLPGLEASVDSLLRVIDNSVSIFNPGSLLSRINRSETDSLDGYIEYCIATAREVSQTSGGLYDITVKPLVQAWGFATEEQEREPNLDSLLQFVGFDKIRVENHRLIKSDPRVQIDLNSVAKGYTTDLLGRLIESRGVERYLVELGGEIFARGKNPKGIPWVVGVDKPVDGNYLPGGQTQIALSITDKGIATSGNYRNFHYDERGRKVVHSINPLTGASSPGDVLSATTVAETCARADALSTAMMVSGFERSMKIINDNPDIWVYLIYTDEKGNYCTYMSPELKKRVVE